MELFRYQKKISSYDKAEWETLVERLLARGAYRRRVVDFSTHVRSYLIDVDLVRGSSFPKAKPTLGVRRVVWLALVRLLLLPGLFRWWRQETSATCARTLLALWTLQLTNLLLYFLAPAPVDVECDSVLVPLGLMLALSVVHAHIVSTTALELGRVRPRHTARRKLPRYFRRARRAGGSGGSAESGTPAGGGGAGGGGVGKPAKFRRRVSLLARAHDEKLDDGPRKRSKTLEKPNMTKDSDLIAKAKSSKAKDSDDEDYMDWKRPLSTPPTVTFTPPPEDELNDENPFTFKPNILTKKRLERLAGTGKEEIRNQNIARISSGDRDDGFESLNGNFSNGSDNESRAKTLSNSLNKISITVKMNDNVSLPSTSSEANIDASRINENEETEESANSEKIFMNIDVKLIGKNGNQEKIWREDFEDKTTKKCRLRKCEGKTENGEGWGLETSEDSQGKIKRTGVRFRNSWVQEVIEHESSDAAPSNGKAKGKKSDEYQSSSSEGGCETASAPSIGLPSHQTMSDWVGQTSNSEECSYSSQSEGSQSDVGFDYADSAWDPFSILNPASDTVKCMMWEKGSMLKAELSAVDISWCVVARAERAMAADGGYLWAGVAMAAVVATVAPAARLLQVALEEHTKVSEDAPLSLLQLPWLLVSGSQGSVGALIAIAFASRAAALGGRDRVGCVRGDGDSARVRRRSAAVGVGHGGVRLAAGGDGVVLLPRRIPTASADARQQRQPQVSRLPLRHHHGADQPAPGDGAARRQQGRAGGRQQRAQVGRRPAQGAGRAVQDLRHLREPLPVHHNQGRDTVGALRRTFRDARLQAQAGQDQDQVVGSSCARRACSRQLSRREPSNS